MQICVRGDMCVNGPFLHEESVNEWLMQICVRGDMCVNGLFLHEESVNEWLIDCVTTLSTSNRIPTSGQ